MKGILNIGNTCYMNSAIQCLSHIPEIRNYFLTGSHINNLNLKSKSKDLTNEWQKLLYRLCQDKDEKNINPIDFVKTFLMTCQKNNINFNGFNQNDVEDFLNQFLDFIHNSISVNIKINITGKIKTIEDKLAYGAAASWSKFFNNSYSHIIDMMYSQLLCTTTCPKCKNTCINYEPLMTLSLSIPPSLVSNNTISLYDLFDSYTAEEILDTDNQWKCDSCHENVNCSKKLTFWYLSNIIIIVIKKYTLSHKINVNIEYPMELDLNKYCINYKENNLNYSLIGSCIHSGGLNGGHYYAICKKYNDWYCYNDDKVSKLDIKQVKHSDAYCLIYRRR